MTPQKPIYSTHEDDATLRSAISDFVVTLAESVDLLQDLHSAGDFAALARRCREHAESATEFGYPAFADLAREVASAADREKAEPAEDGLRALADVARRVRLAHRGAA
jgi:hypothetical protein